ncbi:MAG: cysteine--tRNA ligase, partial [Candidatus Omnitrophica bacterium]|nr:cysteine--tRNA ligase [Candidatus Omnitrophota bacterium]
EEAKKAYERIDILVKKLQDIKEEITLDEDIDGYRLKFEEVMDDDFNTAQALGVIFEIVSFINKNIENEKRAGYAKKTLIDLGKVLGLFEGLTIYYSGGFNKNTALAENVNLLIKNRNDARKKKDFKAADRIRKELEDQGIILEDTKDNTTWRIK